MSRITGKNIIKIERMKESFVFLAEGFEEIEALTPVDVLRRAGMPVKTVSITSSLQVTGAHGVTVNADLLFDNTLFKDAAWLILPGGMPGATNLYEFAPLHGLLQNQYASDHGRIAAICASPAVVLGQMGLLKEIEATCYPGFEGLMEGAKVSNESVVSDNKFVLGAGPALALKWSLAIVAKELGVEKSDAVAAGMLLYTKNRTDVDNYFG